ncbi:MAG TPA: biotin carboxylase N-terminal domain-containing protein [Syntrophales bacterium]|nr:biotin carboxylase N-terminal domain-containing protein [Syntrophales bacterium]
MCSKTVTRKIRRILIANRGEIALRILRTAKEMGIESVVVYETPDSDAYYTRMAEQAVFIGNGPRRDYLDIDKMIQVAKKADADAIHPGYGFLSENPDFAEACEKADIIFIGPPAGVIRDLGDKVMAREIAHRSRIPVLAGSHDLPVGDAGIEMAVAFAREHGYPIMIKATGGGGGRGIRRADGDKELVSQMRRARAEAKSSFKNDNVYIERCIDAPRHIEVQILADQHGNVIHLGSRDCSIQRRHQKLVEIAPANLPEDVLQELYAAAIRAAREAGYVSAGTVEFLVDPKTHQYWFLEINTRLQVEHTVTEELVNIDLVREQIRIAEGHALDIPPDRICLLGKAIQVRINAEDPWNDFAPDGGKTIQMYLPTGGPGIRFDGIVFQGYRIPLEYDSLLVKMTARGYDWEQTVQRLQRALDYFLIAGPKTTIPFHRAICRDADFRAERFDTSYIETHPQIFEFPDPEKEVENLRNFISSVYTTVIFPYVY